MPRHRWADVFRGLRAVIRLGQSYWCRAYNTASVARRFGLSVDTAGSGLGDVEVSERLSSFTVVFDVACYSFVDGNVDAASHAHVARKHEGCCSTSPPSKTSRRG